MLNVWTFEPPKRLTLHLNLGTGSGFGPRHWGWLRVPSTFLSPLTPCYIGVASDTHGINNQLNVQFPCNVHWRGYGTP